MTGSFHVRRPLTVSCPAVPEGQRQLESTLVRGRRPLVLRLQQARLAASSADQRAHLAALFVVDPRHRRRGGLVPAGPSRRRHCRDGEPRPPAFVAAPARPHEQPARAPPLCAAPSPASFAVGSRHGCLAPPAAGPPSARLLPLSRRLDGLARPVTGQVSILVRRPDRYDRRSMVADFCSGGGGRIGSASSTSTSSAAARELVQR